ncbi:MAG: VWA domain-containing protein [Eubacteriales bacterium]|nr:VWA domain-containing protein [Eubacteriales bacterium]
MRNQSGRNYNTGNQRAYGQNSYGHSTYPSNGNPPFGGQSYGQSPFGNDPSREQRIQNGRTSGNKRRGHVTSRVSWIYLICSLAGGAVAFLVGELLLRLIFPNISGIAFSGIYFLVFALFLGLFLLLANRLEGLDLDLKHILLIISGVAFIGGFGILFEFLYEAQISKDLQSSSAVVFAVDNSTVMDSQDSAGERLGSVQEFVKNHEELSYGVYAFDSEVELIRSAARASQSNEMSLPESLDQQAGIYNVLLRLKNDMENGSLPKEKTQIVVIAMGSDPRADWTDADLDNVLAYFIDHKVKIHGISIGNSENQSLLHDIAAKTGGKTSDPAVIGEVSESLSNVVTVEETYATLLSPRKVSEKAWLYVILRILFLFLMGVMCTIIKLCMVDDSVRTGKMTLFSILTSFVGAVLLELILLIPVGFLGRLLYLLMVSVTVAVVEKETKMQYYGSVRDSGQQRNPWEQGGPYQRNPQGSNNSPYHFG